MKKTIAIFSIEFAQEMFRLGHKAIGVEVNKHEPERQVYYFEIDQCAIDDYEMLKKRIRETGTVREIKNRK